MLESTEIKIKEILKSFRDRTGVVYTVLYDSDGLIITVDQASYIQKNDSHQAISAIFASLFSLAESGTNTIKDDNNVKNLTIQVGSNVDPDGFTIILHAVNRDIILTSIFPTSLNLAVILFELNQITQKLSNFLEQYEEQDVNSRVELFT
ncbi:MAG: hypothetical protein GF383_01850 [Candidatus Lokiarchaeota archaeon]|nr:hypothetical protein [Candidatus Lokiarchaeota archaeon]MBD3338088.1 hypothetical protein [Candidatus Lokiarchaeota archaeon]